MHMKQKRQDPIGYSARTVTNFKITDKEGYSARIVTNFKIKNKGEYNYC